jgi:hypothetical protein
MIGGIFNVAIVMSGLCGLTLVLGLAAAIVRRARALARRRELDRVIPEIAGAVVDFAAGANESTAIREYSRTHREALENCLLQYYATLSGAGRDRLADLAMDLGLVQRWALEAQSHSAARRRAALARLSMVAAHEPSRRLSGETLHEALRDPDGYARLEAARTLIHSGGESEVAEIFRVAVGHSLMVRIILADDLRKHVLTLGQKVIPEVLRSKDPAEVAGALELLAAWERAVPLPEVARLAEDGDKAIRLRALRVLPLTPVGLECAGAIQRALADDDEEICIAAANAAGRMRLESAMVMLARCLRRGRVDLCRASASALAALPPRGWETLAELSESEDPATASAAVEALERARKSGMGV